MKSVILLGLFFSFSSLANPTGSSGPSGWEAYSQMQNGNMRFYEGKAQHPNQDISKRDELASGQKPHSIVLSCSDSRVPPETIFDQGLGDIFVVRLAGNVASSEAIASMEYAIEHLGAKLLVVMGHESCGAVAAAAASKPGVSVGSESLDGLVGKIKGNLSAPSLAAANMDKTLRAAVKENVSANVKDLLKRSEIVREAVSSKGLVLASAVYSLKTGRVEFWDVGQKSMAQASSHSAPMIVEKKVESEVITPAAPPKKKEKAHAH